VISKSAPDLVGAVCVLLINRIPVMPNIALGSILAATKQPIYLGFVNISENQRKQ
jgi:hypothetical protein